MLNCIKIQSGFTFSQLFSDLFVLLVYFCWPKTNINPVISLVKIHSFKINKELQIRVCIYGKPCASPPTTRRELFKWENKVEKTIVNQKFTGGTEISEYSGFSLAELWQFLIGCALTRKEEVFLLSIGFCYICVKALSSGLPTLFINFYIHNFYIRDY